MVGEEYIEDLREADAEDALAEQMELQADAQEEVYGTPAPSYEPKDDLYSLFWKVIKITDSSKVGNLDKAELGHLNISVRDCQKIALLALQLDHPDFAKFFIGQAEIILATSASKKGWLTELFVSQKKLKARQLALAGGGEQQQKPPRRGLFKRRPATE